jgi:hypothetical protein
MTSRREFLQAAAFAALSATARAARLQAIGVQLYTVRDVLPQKPAEVLNAIRAIGYREIEATWADYDKIRPMVEASGLKAPSMHIDNTLTNKGADEMSRVADQIKAWGFQYAVYPYMPQNERGGADAIKAFGEKLNRFGEKCRAAGLQFAYHNHAFESAPSGNQTLFQILIDNTDKKLVSFELDCFWLSVPGNASTSPCRAPLLKRSATACWTGPVSCVQHPPPACSTTSSSRTRLPAIRSIVSARVITISRS